MSTRHPVLLVRSDPRPARRGWIAVCVVVGALVAAAGVVTYLTIDSRMPSGAPSPTVGIAAFFALIAMTEAAAVGVVGIGVGWGLLSRYRDRHDHGMWGEIVEGYHRTAPAAFDQPATARAGAPPAP